MNQELYRLYCDGASGARGGKPGGFGWVACRVVPDFAAVAYGLGGRAETTNNRMELYAIYDGLKFFDRAAQATGEVFDDRIVVVSDSQLALGVADGHFSATANRDLAEVVAEIFGRYRARGEWVRGHRGRGDLCALELDTIGNECCDALAGEGKRRAAGTGDFASSFFGKPGPPAVPSSKFFGELARRCA